MADSIRQKLVDAMVSRMQTISVANGYKTELGANVKDWETNWQETELPALSVCDLTTSLSFKGGNTRHTIRELPVQFRIFVASDTPAVTIRQYMDDVERAVRQDDYWTVSNVRLAMHTKPVRDGFELDEAGFAIVAGVVEVEVAFLTQKFNTEE